jgi:hypothetical protein
VFAPQRQTPLPQVPALPALQLVSPAHAQAPAAHEKPGAHAWPHAPQLAGFVIRSAQPPGVRQQV